MERSKQNLTAGPGDAPIKKQGHTKAPKGAFGTDPNGVPGTMAHARKDSAIDLGSA